ncbi:MAG: SBBP repeat-containing protein, partial [Candidatus Aureabacteria bacterium]|nr:SBBP repeat-containing protein [Candidatus Auribacterota bacterium]
LYEPVFSTYLGGGGGEFVFGVTADEQERVYVAGYTNSADFPVKNGYQMEKKAGESAFVTVLDSSGSGLLWSTYIGGETGSTEGFTVQVDSALAVYVNGATTASDFPTLNPFQATHNGGWDAFALKLSSSGSGLIYSTFLGGNNDDWAYKSSLDSGGNFYFAGKTLSPDFPTVNPYQAAYGSSWDAYVVKISSSGSSLVFSTYLGTTNPDVGEMALAWGGKVYVIGTTGGGDFPIKDAYQPNKAGAEDAFITILSGSGSEVLYSTFLGGSGHETGRAIAVDRDGDMYATGACGSEDFPTVNPYLSDRRSGDSWVSKLTSSGSALIFSTYLGGKSSDTSKHICIDDEKNVYVPGHTNSPDFPVVDPFQATLAKNYDAFLSVFSSTGSSLLFSTYLGGSAKDEHYAAWADGKGRVYISGQTGSSDFPTLNPFQAYFGGISDGFIAKFRKKPVPPPVPASSPVSGNQ